MNVTEKIAKPLIASDGKGTPTWSGRIVRVMPGWGTPIADSTNRGKALGEPILGNGGIYWLAIQWDGHEDEGPTLFKLSGLELAKDRRVLIGRRGAIDRRKT
jgi:hypothetical protein